MRSIWFCWSTVLISLLMPRLVLGEEILFEDDFEPGLSSHWQIVGLKDADYRIVNGGLEMRVQPGPLTRSTPMLKVILPFTASDTVVAKVDVTVLDPFTEPKEFAGVYLIDEDGREFGAKKQWMNGQMVFAPGKYIFQGQPGEEGDPDKYAVNYSHVKTDDGPLRIIVRGSHAYFQVGPSATGNYQNFFHSAIRKNSKKRGFSLIAAGAPNSGEHWVRFDNFRVTKD